MFLLYFSEGRQVIFLRAGLLALKNQAEVDELLPATRL